MLVFSLPIARLICPFHFYSYFSKKDYKNKPKTSDYQGKLAAKIDSFLLLSYYEKILKLICTDGNYFLFSN